MIKKILSQACCQQTFKPMDDPLNKPKSGKFIMNYTDSNYFNTRDATDYISSSRDDSELAYLETIKIICFVTEKTQSDEIKSSNHIVSHEHIGDHYPKNGMIQTYQELDSQ